MHETLPIVFIPGLLCSARLYAQQIPRLWQIAPVMVADHRRDDTIAAIAARILANAPPRFALAGLSMGGYIAFVVAQQAPERVQKLALLDTSARPETPRQTERRLEQIALAESGRLADVAELLFPLFVHRDRHGDDAPQARGADDGRGDRAGSLRAATAGDHGAPRPAPAFGVDPLPDARSGGRRRRTHPAAALRGDRRRDRRLTPRRGARLRTSLRRSNGRTR